jgi:serine protease Do
MVKMFPHLNELRNAVAAIHPGKKVPVQLLRSGKKITVHVTMSGRDKNDGPEKGEKKGSTTPENENSDYSKKLGIQVTPLTPEIKTRHGIKGDIKGVVIEKIDEQSLIAREDSSKAISSSK